MVDLLKKYSEDLKIITKSMIIALEIPEIRRLQYGVCIFLHRVRLLNVRARARAHPLVYMYVHMRDTSEGERYENRISRETSRKIGSPVPAKYVCFQGSRLEPTRSRRRGGKSLCISRGSSSCFFPFPLRFSLQK